jgi:hypothetical protein
LIEEKNLKVRELFAVMREQIERKIRTLNTFIVLAGACFNNFRLSFFGVKIRKIV